MSHVIDRAINRTMSVSERPKVCAMVDANLRVSRCVVACGSISSAHGLVASLHVREPSGLRSDP